jgi:hypothetical protein
MVEVWDGIICIYYYFQNNNIVVTEALAQAVQLQRKRQKYNSIDGAGDSIGL